MKVWLQDRSTLQRLQFLHGPEQSVNIAQLCAYIAPSLDVRLKTKDGDNWAVAVEANDWLTISDAALLSRIYPFNVVSRSIRGSVRATQNPPLRIIRDSDGCAVGRIALWYWETANLGILTVGGLRASGLNGLRGVLSGSSARATRDAAVPSVSMRIVREWGNEEVAARLSENLPTQVQSAIADVATILGIDPGELPLAESKSGWLTETQIRALAKELEEVTLVDCRALDFGGSDLTVELADGVLAISTGWFSALQRDFFDWPPVNQWNPNLPLRYNHNSTETLILASLAAAWDCTPEAMIMASSISTHDEDVEREIGKVEGKPFVTRVDVIRRPKAPTLAPVSDACNDPHS